MYKPQDLVYLNTWIEGRYPTNVNKILAPKKIVKEDFVCEVVSVKESNCYVLHSVYRQFTFDCSEDLIKCLL